MFDTQDWQHTKIKKEQNKKEMEQKISALEKNMQIENKHEQNLQNLEVKNQETIVDIMKSYGIISN